MMEPAIDVRVTTDPLSPAPLEPDGESGAVVTFAGVVRARTGDRETTALEYEAYEEMTGEALERIAREAAGRFGLRAVLLHHRTGRVLPGETALLVRVAAPHRADAFAACARIVDDVKRDVPVWKREAGPDGSFWVEPPPGP